MHLLQNGEVAFCKMVLKFAESWHIGARYICVDNVSARRAVKILWAERIVKSHANEVIAKSPYRRGYSLRAHATERFRRID